MKFPFPFFVPPHFLAPLLRMAFAPSSSGMLTGSGPLGGSLLAPLSRPEKKAGPERSGRNEASRSDRSVDSSSDRFHHAESRIPRKRFGVSAGDRKIFFEKDIRYENPKHNRAMEELLKNPAVAAILDKPQEQREFNRLLREKSRETKGGGVTAWALQEALQTFRNGKGKSIDYREGRDLAWAIFPGRSQTRYRTAPGQSPEARGSGSRLAGRSSSSDARGASRFLPPPSRRLPPRLVP